MPNMSPSPDLIVRDAPAKPVMLFDGDCHFCRHWIERWRDATGEHVDYIAYQEAADRFSEIPRESFTRAVHFIEPDGNVWIGASGVFRSLGYGRSRSLLKVAYERLPGFAVISKVGYRFIARHRGFASAATRLLWGDEVRRPSYFAAREWFLRALGAIYLIAFASLWVQVDGLIGERGILPVRDFLTAARGQLGASAVAALPTLCWLNSSNGFLHLLCGSGVAISILLIIGFAPAASLAALFALYLSLTIAGQTFLSFQWDILLLETGFLAIFLAPARLRFNSGDDPPPSRVAVFLFKLLLFKLMVMSGVTKLTSGDASWWDLTALNYHYETQPLPTVVGWWAHQSPEWFRHFSTLFVLVVESVVPFFIWAPRRLRSLACALLIALQVLIALTGNYCFFNLLTIALSLLLIDDFAFRYTPVCNATTEAFPNEFRKCVATAVLIATLPLNAMLIVSAFAPECTWPTPLAAIYSFTEPFRIVNGYGLFRVMTKTRAEIEIEGSDDGVGWRRYDFKWKPGALGEPPRWVAPHQPRLDWQMWFAALGTYRDNPWFLHLVESLLTNRSTVLGLLATNPFPTAPPRYVRATLYEYHFTTEAERRASGHWWKREARGEYLPTASLGNR